MPDLKDLKLNGSTVSDDNIMDLILYQAQVRKMVPRFPGSEILSRITILLFETSENFWLKYLLIFISII